MFTTFTCAECGVELHADSTNREDADGNSIDGTVEDIARDNGWQKGFRLDALRWVCPKCLVEFNYC